MSEKTRAVPQGFHTLTPHLVVRDADRAIEFYQKAFGAELQGGVARGPDGKVIHAQLRIGDSNLMLNDEMPEYGSRIAAFGRQFFYDHTYLHTERGRGI